MTEDRPPLRFGIFPMPDAGAVEETVELAISADRLGIDLVGIQDHPYQRRHVDTYTLLTWMAAHTERIRLFADVTNLPLRPPAVLAKTAASLDVLSGGRFELGLGAGGFWDAIAAMDGPRRRPGEAVEALGEAIGIIRAMWSGERSVRVDGDHYRLDGLRPGPPPAHPMEIWIGAGGPRMLNLIGTAADGWVASSPYLPQDRLQDAHQIIDQAAEDAGRNPADIRRIYNVRGTVGQEPDEGGMGGDVSRWVDRVEQLYMVHRMDSLVLWAEGDPEPELTGWAEVADRTRDRLGV